MKTSREPRFGRIVVPAFFLMLGFAAAASSTDPYIAFIYPAGIRRGETVRVRAAGQLLRGASAALVSGKGVTAKIIEYIGPGGPLDKLQQEELDRRLREIAEIRKGGKREAAPEAPLAVLPDLPELRDLDKRTPEELAIIKDRFAAPDKRPKPPMSETVVIELTAAPDAALGDRDLRLLTAAGISTPILLQIGALPELPEIDPLDTAEIRGRGPAVPPIVLNGCVMPGEEDRLRFSLRAGEETIFAVQARNLIPYLADAVPGWFQATVSLYDESGRELAFADDNGPDPDPVLRFTAPRDGVYTLGIRDSIYRGRWDFIYRVYAFTEAEAARQFPAGSGIGVPIARGAPPVPDSWEPNDGMGQATIITKDIPVRAVIGVPGDRDVFKFTGKAGDSIVARTEARSAGSPVDTRLRLLDGAGTQLASNDDFADPTLGLSVHHADSRVTAKLPSDGVYYLDVTDASSRGGSDYRYTLRLETPAPGFSLLSAQSALNLLPGGSAELEVRAVRRGGWEGDIALELVGAPEGFELNCGLIPAGRDRARCTLTAPTRATDVPVELRLRGVASIGGVVRAEPVVPADLRMQAFGNTHLVRASSFLANVLRRAQTPRFRDETERSLILKAGGGVEAAFSMKTVPPRPITAELVDPPAGITIASQRVEGDRLILRLSAAPKSQPRSENLIIAVGYDEEQTAAKGTAAEKRRVPQGTLPAIRITIE